MKRIAFLGLGAMGSRMAARLVSDFDLVVYNRTRARAQALRDAGASVADTPRAAAEGADVVMSIVTDDDAARKLWLDPEHGALAGLEPDALAIESSTVTPSWIDELATATRGRLLDAPVAGSTPQAEAGQLAFLVGGDATDVTRATPLMLCMGAKILHAGPQTHGAKLKLVVNALFAGQVALVAELLAAASTQGLDAAHTAELLGAMPVMSPAAAVAAKMMAAADHAPRFPVDLVVKDLGYAQSLGNTPLTRVAREQFQRASAEGHGSLHLTAVHLLSRPV